MNVNKNSKFTEEVKAFETLLNQGVAPQDLKKQLTELFFDYSRKIIQHYQEDLSDEVCPVGDPQDQLYALLQIIAVCDASAKEPLASSLLYEKAA